MTQNLRHAFAIIAATFALGAVSANGQIVSDPASPQVEIPTINENAGYVLGPGDVVEIAVLGRDEFKPRVQVQADGTVELPYLRTLKVAGLTVLQLRDQVAKLLRAGGYYTDPVVNVSIAGYSSRYVTVLGEFNTPGILMLERNYRVSEILARAGGARPTAGDSIVIRRGNGEAYELPLSKVAGGGLTDDPFVQAGDKLYLAAAPNFYIYGQVGAPGSYKIERGMTVRMALARGGGVTDRGSVGKVSVYRAGKKVKVDIDSILNADDTVYVGERLF